MALCDVCINFTDNMLKKSSVSSDTELFICTLGDIPSPLGRIVILKFDTARVRFQYSVP